MATNTVQNPVILCNNEIAIEIFNGKPVVQSKEIALRFQKKHQHVLRDIEKIRSALPESFSASNFGLAKYVDIQGKSRPSYNLTRDAFSLLAMGFTGKAAILWKLKYIEAFNSLEQGVIAQGSEIERLTKEKQRYLDGLEEGKRLQKQHDGLVSLDRALDYIAKGLSMADAAKLTDMPRYTLGTRIARLRKKLIKQA